MDLTEIERKFVHFLGLMQERLRNTMGLEHVETGSVSARIYREKIDAIDAELTKAGIITNDGELTEAGAKAGFARLYRR